MYRVSAYSVILQGHCNSPFPWLRRVPLPRASSACGEPQSSATIPAPRVGDRGGAGGPPKVNSRSIPNPLSPQGSLGIAFASTIERRFAQRPLARQQRTRPLRGSLSGEVRTTAPSGRSVKLRSSKGCGPGPGEQIQLDATKPRTRLSLLCPSWRAGSYPRSHPRREHDGQRHDRRSGPFPRPGLPLSFARVSGCTCRH